MGAAYLDEIKGRNSPNLGHNTILAFIGKNGLNLEILTQIEKKWNKGRRLENVLLTKFSLPAEDNLYTL